MNTLSEDISEAIGTYSEPFLPWIVAVLENYAIALRQQMNKHGNKLLDAIKKAAKQDVIRMCVPQKKVESDADIPD